MLNENLMALSSRQDDSNRAVDNIYEPIGTVPIASQNLCASSPSSEPKLLSSSPPEAAAAAAGCSDDKNNVYSQPVDDDVMNTYTGMSPSPRYTALLPTLPETAATISFTDEVDPPPSDISNHNLEELAAVDDEQNNGSGNVGNIYESIDDVPSRYMNMSRSTAQPPTPAAEAAATVSFTDDDDTPTSGDRLHHNLKEAAPIDDQQDNSCRNIGHTYDSIDEVPVTYQNLDAPASQPTPLPLSTSDEAASYSEDGDNVYIPPGNKINNVPCCYQIEPNAKPNDGAYANCSQQITLANQLPGESEA